MESKILTNYAGPCQLQVLRILTTETGDVYSDQKSLNGGKSSSINGALSTDNRLCYKHSFFPQNERALYIWIGRKEESLAFTAGSPTECNATRLKMEINSPTYQLITF